MLMVVATVAVVVVFDLIGINGVEEAAQAKESGVRDAHQQNCDARRSPRQVGQVSVHFSVVGGLLFALRRGVGIVIFGVAGVDAVVGSVHLAKQGRGVLDGQVRRFQRFAGC